MKKPKYTMVENEKESLFRIIGFLSLIPIAFLFIKMEGITNYFADSFGITENTQLFKDAILGIFIALSGCTVYFIGKKVTLGRPILQKIFGWLLAIHYLIGIVFAFYILIMVLNSNY